LNLKKIDTLWYRLINLKRKPSNDLRKGQYYYEGHLYKKDTKEKRQFHIYANNKEHLTKKIEKKYFKQRKKRRIGRPPNIEKYREICKHHFAYGTNPCYVHEKNIFNCSQATIDRALRWFWNLPDKERHKIKKSVNKYAQLFEKGKDYKKPFTRKTIKRKNEMKFFEGEYRSQ